MGSSRVKYDTGKPSAAAIDLASFSLKTIKPFCNLLSFDWEMCERSDNSLWVMPSRCRACAILSAWYSVMAFISYQRRSDEGSPFYRSA